MKSKTSASYDEAFTLWSPVAVEKDRLRRLSEVE
jgi:hypothetical protein